MTRNEEALTTMVTSTIVEFYNEYAAQPVKKFQDKATAVRRTAAVLDEAGMEFDDVCQLRPKPIAATQTDDGPVAAEGAEEADEASLAEMLALVEAPDEAPIKVAIEDAFAVARGEKTLGERRAATDRQPSLKGERLAVVGGKDAANPFREGSKSHAAFAYLQANHGSTYEELKAAGVRMRAITHGKKQGWIRTL